MPLLRLSLGRLLSRPDLVLVQDPRLARRLLNASTEFPKGQSYRPFREVTPGHLPGLDGEAAARKRSVALRCLNRARLDRLRPTLHHLAETVADAVAASTATRPLELGAAMRAYTLGAICLVVLGEPGLPPPVYAALRCVMDEWQHRLVEPFAVQHWRWWPRQRRLAAAQAQVRAFLAAQLRTAPEASLLHDLCAEASLSDDERIELAFTLLAMGHENLASSLIWMLVGVAEHGPRLQSALEAEWAVPAERTPPTTHRVLKEALRLYPPIPLLSRRAATPEALRALGVDAPDEELEWVVAPYVLHRAKAIWGANADQFAPERWCAPTAAMVDAFMPFGSGPRVCFGQQLAALEQRTLFGALFRRRGLRLGLVRPAGAPVLRISLKPRGDVWLCAMGRSPPADI